jgi:hypothetical protein
MNEPSCANCKHWHGGMACDAYPKGIPWPIISGDVAHTHPLPDDNGIQWERKDETDTTGDRQQDANGSI